MAARTCLLGLCVVRGSGRHGSTYLPAGFVCGKGERLSWQHIPACCVCAVTAMLIGL